MELLALLALYGIWNWLMWVGVYKGYQPEQPIYFSLTKFTLVKIKSIVRLCHSSAKYGKVFRNSFYERLYELPQYVFQNTKVNIIEQGK